MSGHAVQPRVSLIHSHRPDPGIQGHTVQCKVWVGGDKF